MSRTRAWTVPYPMGVDRIESMIRHYANSDHKYSRQEGKELARDILAAEYGARRPRYSLIRFLKAHR